MGLPLNKRNGKRFHIVVQTLTEETLQFLENTAKRKLYKPEKEVDWGCKRLCHLHDRSRRSGDQFHHKRHHLERHLLTAWFIASMIPGGRVVVVVVLRVVRRGVSRVVERVGRCVVRTVDVGLPSVLSCKLSNVVDVSAPFIGLPSVE